MVLKRDKKLRLSRTEEFELLKLIFDKLLWVGTLSSLYGLYLLLEAGSGSPDTGLIAIGIGAFFLFIFTSIVVGTIHLPDRS
jgi:hypothetical protein